jgi:U3 small nucleolar ribonucleoprotein component
LARELHIRTSNWAPDFVSKDTLANFLSPISIEYLNRMKLLAEEHHFQLIILPPPINTSVKESVENIDRSAIIHNDLTDLFRYYFENITYVDESCFFDWMHLKEEYSKQYTNIYINKWLLN